MQFSLFLKSFVLIELILSKISSGLDVEFRKIPEGAKNSQKLIFIGRKAKCISRNYEHFFERYEIKE